MQIALSFLLPSLALNSPIRDPFALCLLGLEASICDSANIIKFIKHFKDFYNNYTIINKKNKLLRYYKGFSRIEKPKSLKKSLLKL